MSTINCALDKPVVTTLILCELELNNTTNSNLKGREHNKNKYFRICYGKCPPQKKNSLCIIYIIKSNKYLTDEQSESC